MNDRQAMEQGGACEVEFYEYEPEVEYAQFVAIGPLEQARRNRARRYAAAVKNHPALTAVSLLAFAALAGAAWAAWQRRPAQRYRRQFQGERLGPLWQAPPQDARGVTAPSEERLRTHREPAEVEPTLTT